MRQSTIRKAIILAALAAPALPAALAAQALDRLATPELQSCDVAKDRNWCRHGLKTVREQLPQAREGNYQAMRNIAFCLIDGCDGAVKPDRAGGCGWRRAIMQVHGGPGGRAERSDEANLDLCKGWGF